MRLALLLMAAVCGVAVAQPARPLEPGARLRVSILVPPEVDSTGFHSRDRVVGNYLIYDSLKIVLDAEPRAIPWAAVSRLEISDGRHGNAGRGALYGALIGLLAGVVTGATIGRDENGGEGNEDFEDEFAAGFGLAGLLGGAGIGAIVGGRLKTDDWRPLELANETRPEPAGSSQ